MVQTFIHALMWTAKNKLKMLVWVKIFLFIFVQAKMDTFKMHYCDIWTVKPSVEMQPDQSSQYISCQQIELECMHLDEQCTTKLSELILT